MNHITRPIVDLSDSKLDWPISPDALSLEELLVQKQRAVDTVVDIGLQILQEKHNYTPHPPGWVNRAARARQSFQRKVELFDYLIKERHAAAKRQTKLAVAEIHAARQGTQDALFIRYILAGKTRDECAALWQAVRAAFPGDPAWNTPAEVA